MRRTARVETSGRIPRKGRPRIWAYGYTDLAVLFGMSEGAVRKAAERGRFDPGSLASVLEYATRRRAKRTSPSDPLKHGDAWKAEIDQRIDDVREGRVKLVAHEEVMDDIDRKLAQRRAKKAGG